MAEHDFRQVTGFLIDPELNTRRLLRSILSRIGLNAVQEFSGTTEAIGALAVTAPDFMLVDADFNDGEGLRFIHALRHNQFATNPFIGVVAMTWQPTPNLLVRFTGSGADDLMMKPFSTRMVHERVQNLVEGRKPFVVTSDYIGPDRRKTPRPEGQHTPLFSVPNTMRLKALGCFDRAAVADEIAVCLMAVNAQKVARQGFQVAFLVEFALPGVTVDPPGRLAVDHLLRVPGIVEDLMRRMPQGTEERQAAARHARAIQAALDRFKDRPDRPLGDAVAGLRRSAMALAAQTGGRGDLGAVEQEVANAVATYRSRLDQMTQARAGTTPQPAPDFQIDVDEVPEGARAAS